MDIRVLNYFLAVCEHGSMTRAAEALHLTQPTLSRQIADMERELGCSLFTRSGRRLELTSDGIYLRRRAQEIVSLAEATKADLRHDAGELSGVVRIAAGESWAIQQLAAVMKAFLDQHPHVSFAIHSGNAEDVSWRLERGLADFAVFMATPVSERYNHMRLAYTDTWGLLMPEGHKLAERAAIAPIDLVGVPLIMPGTEQPVGALGAWLGKVARKITVTCTYSLAYNASLLVREGLGSALMFDRLIPAGTGTGLEFRPLAPEVTSHIDFAWKQHEALAPAPKAFLDKLMEAQAEA